MGLDNFKVVLLAIMLWTSQCHSAAHRNQSSTTTPDPEPAVCDQSSIYINVAGLVNWHIPEREFYRRCPAVKAMRLKNNVNLTIDALAFANLTQLEKLEVSKAGVDVAPPIQPVCPNLKVLLLMDNNLKFLPIDYFDGCLRLKTVMIRGNVIPKVNFVPLKNSIQVLDLSHNKLLDLGSAPKTVFPFLRDAKFMSNLLQEVDLETMLSNWIALQLLWLSHNQIKSLSDPSNFTANSGPAFVSMELEGNPFACDANLTWMMDSRKTTCGNNAHLEPRQKFR